MLAVIGIVALLLVLAVPPVNSVLESSQVNQATELVSGALLLAHQMALSRNHCVEVRLYQYVSSDVPGETVNVPSTGKFRALQLFDVQNTGQAVPLNRVQILPGTTMMDSGRVLSSLIGAAQTSTANAPTLTSGTTLNVSIPAAGTQYNAVVFQFRPDGSTNLPVSSATSWFLTLHASRYGDQQPAPPINFCTLELNPNNGHLNSFRP